MCCAPLKTPAALEDAKEGWCCCCCIPSCNKTMKIENMVTQSSSEEYEKPKEAKMIKCCCFNIKKRTEDTESDSLPAINVTPKAGSELKLEGGEAVRTAIIA